MEYSNLALSFNQIFIRWVSTMVMLKLRAKYSYVYLHWNFDCSCQILNWLIFFSWFSTYDDLLSTTQPFPQAIPLWVCHVTSTLVSHSIVFKNLRLLIFILKYFWANAGNGWFFGWYLAWRRALRLGGDYQQNLSKWIVFLAWKIIRLDDWRFLCR